MKKFILLLGLLFVGFSCFADPIRVYGDEKYPDNWYEYDTLENPKEVMESVLKQLDTLKVKYNYQPDDSRNKKIHNRFNKFTRKYWGFECNYMYNYGEKPFKISGYTFLYTDTNKRGKTIYHKDVILVY